MSDAERRKAYSGELRDVQPGATVFVPASFLRSKGGSYKEEEIEIVSFSGYRDVLHTMVSTTLVSHGSCNVNGEDTTKTIYRVPGVGDVRRIGEAYTWREESRIVDDGAEGKESKCDV